jgi:DNA-binding Lrp family transcriptional regulator
VVAGPATGPTVDEHDYAIYRYLSPDGQARFWGTRRLLDPRVSVREIADRVGLSEAGTRARLKTLEARGILRGRETWLNPSLFGASLVVAELPVPDAMEARRLLDELALVDGVTFARDILDEEDRKLRVYFVADAPRSTERRTALIRRLSSSGRLRGPSPYWIPACSRSPTPLDWRLLASFRAHPELSIAGYASEVGVSVKTTAARFHALLDSYACWWTPAGTSEEMPLGLLTIALRPSADRPSVLREVVRAIPSWIPVAPDGFGVEPGLPDAPLVGLAPAEGPAVLERAVRTIAESRSVTRVGRTFALGSARYPNWLDENLERQVARRA